LLVVRSTIDRYSTGLLLTAVRGRGYVVQVVWSYRCVLVSID